MSWEKYFDKVFRDKLSKGESYVPEHLWTNIESELDSLSRRKRGSFLSTWAILLMSVIVVSAGVGSLVLLRPESSIEKQKKPIEQVVPTQKQQLSATEPTPGSGNR